MLTPTDVHYLVGLLMKAWEGADVDLIAGDQVYDIASEKTRDVDITIRDKNGLSIFKGIEVKKHSKPLDVEDVEQLCSKFSDMSTITYKAIVSASGYSKAAVKKAKFHKVDLFELVPWNGLGVSNLMFFAEHFSANEYSHEWVEVQLPILHLTPEDQEKIKGSTFDDLQICTPDGRVPSNAPQMKVLMGMMAEATLSAYSQREIGGNFEMVPGVYEIPVNIPGTLPEPQYYKYNEVVVPVYGFTFSGIARFTISEQKSCFKVLVKHGENDPYVGCAIFEMQNGSLMGVATTKENPFQIIQIPKVDRLKNKIYHQQIT
jgi:hypothetical protein